MDPTGRYLFQALKSFYYSGLTDYSGIINNINMHFYYNNLQLKFVYPENILW